MLHMLLKGRKGSNACCSADAHRVQASGLVTPRAGCAIQSNEQQVIQATDASQQHMRKSTGELGSTHR
jgi:hypothetical protein